MRIVFIDLPTNMTFNVGTPEQQPLGGMASCVCYLARALAARGHDVTLVATLPEVAVPEFPARIEDLPTWFAREIVPLAGVSADEGPREPNWDKIRSLPTLVEGGRITAALASQISDAATAVLVVSERALAEHGLTPRARIHHLSVRGDDPIMMLSAPIRATEYALGKAGITAETGLKSIAA